MFSPVVHQSKKIVASITYEDQGNDYTNTTSHTVTDMAIGAADPNRFVLVGIGTLDLSSYSDWSPDSVTIAGISATKINSTSGVSSGYTTSASLWIAAVPTGTTATVVANYNTSVNNGVFLTHRLISSTSVPADTDTGVSTSDDTVTSKSMTTPTVGLAFTNVRDNNGVSAVTWGGTASAVEAGALVSTYNSYASAIFSIDGTISTYEGGNEVNTLVVTTWE